MKKLKRMAGLFLMTVLFLCQGMVSSAATQETLDAEQSYSDAYAPKEYYHFDFTEKPEPEEKASSKDVANSGFLIGLGTTAAGGIIAAVIIIKKQSGDGE